MTPPIDDAQEIFRQCADLLAHLDVLLGAYEPLTPDEIRHLPRLARRREVIVSELATLCREVGIDGGGVGSLEDMVRSCDEVVASRRLLEQLDLVRARLDAMRHQAQARTTRQAHLFYDLVRHAALDDDALRARVAPIVDRFRTKRTRSALTPRRPSPRPPGAGPST